MKRALLFVIASFALLLAQAGYDVREAADGAEALAAVARARPALVHTSS